ncbi:MAG: 50S ribosomal protein L23 [Oscillospiraceae bacterium]|jgi:large subunit ribosomal protein L23|nr:50S ribosomal protein L23 [Oscillospiraceae bacterium]
MIANDVIINPVVTEKTMRGSPMKKYTFKVAKSAGKIEIRKAVEEIFKVKVMKVNVLNIRGRLRRQRGKQGYTPSWKKAVVRLTSGSKAIDFFDSMV